MKRKLFLFSLITFVLALAIAGCQREGCTDPKATNYDSDAKKDNGTCVYPEEPTPVVPTKEITIDFDWYDRLDEALNMDTIRKYVNMEDVKFVFLNLQDDNGVTSSNFSASVFHSAVNNLQPRFDISNKVCGSGTIFVSGEWGAQWPDSVPGGYSGMYASDSTKFANWGYQIKRFQGIPARSK
ncbi:MAG: hypothetical protein IKP45_08000 [Bacteroidales bacterium]|nr:hypothetical protein [Bacteroidales bacterium]